MGNKPLDPNFKFYNCSMHPIEGEVTVYSLVGEGTFVMSLFGPSEQERIELLKKISHQQSQNLITYYGATQKQQLFVNCQVRKKDEYESDSVFYWEFLNYDLNNLMQKERNQIPESTLIGILENITMGAADLSKYGVYPQIKPQYVQFTAGRQAKLYWANIELKNMHRAYFKFFHLGQYAHSLYAPEEMYSLKIRNINNKINLSKCVVFSIGVVLLQAATGGNTKQIYHYRDFQFLNDKKDRLIQKAERTYSFEFTNLLKGMLDRYPPNRLSYDAIINRINQIKAKQSFQKDSKHPNITKVSLRMMPT